jgi:RimJ/RimL family protein N-acetyltransferase
MTGTAAQPLTTARLALEPLRAEHAQEMAPLLDDPALHGYTGGRPDTAEELRERYARQAAGRSPDGSARWCNWIVRRRDTGDAVGTVQATITDDDRHGSVAEVAWVVASAHQRQGYAREATAAMVAWLRAGGVGLVVAHVHPEHRASMAVARGVGLRPTELTVDGEVRWQG